MEQVGAGADVVRGDVVGQVDDLGVRIDPEDHTLHAADEHVGRAEVRQQGDDGRWDRFRAIRRPYHVGFRGAVREPPLHVLKADVEHFVLHNFGRRLDLDGLPHPLADEGTPDR